jgi:hypothetical protein
LRVERYVLSQFKVYVDLTGKDARVKRGYRPGDHVTGTVRSNYFFGKPVGHAEIVVIASAVDVALVDAAKIAGTTDGDGAFSFDIRLPDFFAGQAANHGAARLDSAAQHQVNFPATAIPDASTLFVRLYPGPLSQVVEGMDSLLRMPFGCFEQTSSSTYPNVLALDYMKRTKKLTPEVSAKAQGYIATGYQRLVTFEVPGGGFSWFGSAPANKILTSYGLMEFSDMSKVHDVDPKVIQRTQQWLADQQQGDGSWQPDRGGINEGATNRFQPDVLRITGYVAWALDVTGYQGPAVDRARQFIETHLDESMTMDAYTLAGNEDFDRREDRTGRSGPVEGRADRDVWQRHECRRGDDWPRSTGAAEMGRRTGCRGEGNELHCRE